jgi:hypothetical protein
MRRRFERKKGTLTYIRVEFFPAKAEIQYFLANGWIPLSRE